MLIEHISELAWEEAGEVAEDCRFDASSEAVLQAFISQWAHKHFKADYFLINNQTAYIVSQWQIDQARGETK